MTVQRFIVCDGPDCNVGVAISHEAPLRDMLPEGWCGFIVYPSAQDHHFCSFECLYNFAGAEVQLHNEDAIRNAQAQEQPVPAPLCERCEVNESAQTIRNALGISVNVCADCLKEYDAPMQDQIAAESTPKRRSHRRKTQ